MKNSKILKHILALTEKDFNILSENLAKNNILLHVGLFTGPCESLTVQANKYNFSLISAEGFKLNTVKQIKESFNLPLFESKQLMDSAPCILKSNISLHEAEELKTLFTKSGAKVEIH
jgi:ribosomal protein L7/L12